MNILANITTTKTTRQTIPVDPAAPFDAHAYYTGLRAIGVNPCIHQRSDGGFGESGVVGRNNGVTGDVAPYSLWAMTGDPDMSLRKAYVFAAWDNRPASDLPIECQYVELGAEPEAAG
jgi:hypothetical protein